MPSYSCWHAVKEPTACSRLLHQPKSSYKRHLPGFMLDSKANFPKGKL
jgi:hypothetical protein